MSDEDHDLETITPEISKEIFRFHEENENLGHGGILHLLTDAGFDVDSHELKKFLKRNKIHGDRWTLKSRLLGRWWPWTGG